MRMPAWGRLCSAPWTSRPKGARACCGPWLSWCPEPRDAPACCGPWPSWCPEPCGGWDRMNPVPKRFLLAAFGDPGHAFPAIALGKSLVARGHEVRLQTWKRWQEHVEREGMGFEPSPEYKVFPTPDTPGLKPYQAAVRAARETQPLIEEFAPDAVVADILTVAAGLAAELAGVRWASLVPH